MRILFLIIFVSINFVSAQDTPEQYRSDKVVFEKITSLNIAELDDFPVKLKEVFEESHRYVEEMKKICTGVYSTVVVGEDGSTTKSNKLTPQETEVCYRDLKSYQIKFVESIFDAKKMFLKKLNNISLVKLEEAKQVAVSRIHNNFVRKLLK